MAIRFTVWTGGLAHPKHRKALHLKLRYAKHVFIKILGRNQDGQVRAIQEIYLLMRI